MRLSREAIQRMVGDRVGGGGGAGGGGGISMDDIQGMGFATEQWVNEKYLSIDFFNRLFQAYDSAATPNQVLPNDLESTITNIKAMFGFWTEQFVSALGYGPGGGGGGDTLTEPLASINSASLGMPTAAGQVITWNGSEWIFDIPQGGGGGGTGTVTSITAGTGLSGGTITTMGTIAISSTYQGYISHGETAYGWGNHADAGYATQQWVNQQGFLTSSAISDMATQTWVGQQGFLTSSAISDMATKTWVNQQGFLTSETYTGTVTSVGLSMPQGFSVSDSPVTSSGTLSVGIATGYFIPTTTQRTTWNGKQDAISDLSTIRSGAAAGATAVQPSDISDMATQTWVGQQGFITASALSSYLPLTGGTLTGALHMGSSAGASPYIYWGDGTYAYIGEDSDDHITLRGDKGVNILTGSSYELEWNGDTLATQDWVEGQGYVTSNQIHEAKWWGQSMDGNNVVSGDIAMNVGDRIYYDGNNTLEVDSYSVALGYGWRSTKPMGLYGTTINFYPYGSQVASVDSGGLRVNGGYYLDGKLFANNNNGLHIGYGFADAELPTTIWGDGISFRSSDGNYGSCTNIGNTYGIMGTDFIGVTNKFRFEYDSTNNTVWVLKADGTPVNFASLGGISALGVGGGSSSASINNLEVRDLSVTDELMLNGNTIYMDGGNIQDAYNIQTSELKVGSGGSTIKKIYWNGTYLQVQIGSSTYNFRPV